MMSPCTALLSTLNVTVRDRMVKVDVNHTLPHCILSVWGRGGVNETESTVKGARAGETQSWHCAGNELVWGDGESLPGSVRLSE